MAWKFQFGYVQMPRPRNEKRNEAYLEIWGGIWNSAAS